MCTLKGKGHVSRQSIHKDQSKVSNALSVVSHVDTDTVDTRDQSTSCFNGSNAMLCRYSQYKIHTHVCAHNFLNIQRISNPEKSYVC